MNTNDTTSYESHEKNSQSQSKSIKNLVGAFVQAQALIRSAIEDSNNPFFKSGYASLGSVWKAVKGPLGDNNLCIIQTIDRVSDKTCLITILAHSSGEWIKSFYPINPVKNDPQGVGSAITYAKRYSIAAMCGVVSGEDDDGESAMGRNNSQKPSIAPSQTPKSSHTETKVGIKEKDLKQIVTLAMDQKWTPATLWTHAKSKYGYDESLKANFMGMAKAEKERQLGTQGKLV